MQGRLHLLVETKNKNVFFSLFISRIGLCGFENPMRSPKTDEIKRQIGQVSIEKSQFCFGIHVLQGSDKVICSIEFWDDDDYCFYQFFANRIFFSLQLVIAYTRVNETEFLSKMKSLEIWQTNWVWFHIRVPLCDSFLGFWLYALVFKYISAYFDCFDRCVNF